MLPHSSDDAANRFAKDLHMLFFCANTTQRLAVNRAVSAHVRSDSESFDKFAELVSDAGFLKMLEEARDDVPELEAAPIAPTSTRPPPPACPTGGDGDEGCGRVEGEVEGETTQQRRGALHVHAVVVWPAGSDGHPRLAP